MSVASQRPSRSSSCQTRIPEQCNGGAYKRVNPSVVSRLAVEKGMTEEPFGTDEALVEGLKVGEQLAQLILVKRYGPRVKYLIKSISWDLAEEDAKEVASATSSGESYGAFAGSIRRGERSSVLSVGVMTARARPPSRRTAGAPRTAMRRRFSRMCRCSAARRPSGVVCCRRL